MVFCLLFFSNLCFVGFIFNAIFIHFSQWVFQQFCFGYCSLFFILLFIFFGNCLCNCLFFYLTHEFVCNVFLIICCDTIIYWFERDTLSHSFSIPTTIRLNSLENLFEFILDENYFHGNVHIYMYSIQSLLKTSQFKQWIDCKFCEFNFNSKNTISTWSWHNFSLIWIE